jgi:hypothetical protein
MNIDALTMVEREVLQWPGVTTGDTGRGGLQFNYGRVELGHLHGSSFADRSPRRCVTSSSPKDEPRCTRRFPTRGGCAGGWTAQRRWRP